LGGFGEPDSTFSFLDREGSESSSEAGAGDAAAGEGFVESAVVAALDVGAVGGEEVAIAMIEEDGPVATLVFVGDEPVLPAKEDGFQGGGLSGNLDEDAAGWHADGDVLAGAQGYGPLVGPNMNCRAGRLGEEWSTRHGVSARRAGA
jgi:hypothetical protein